MGSTTPSAMSFNQSRGKRRPLINRNERAPQHRDRQTSTFAHRQGYRRHTELYGPYIDPKTAQTNMDHPLENLGPERFQLFCQTLLAQEFPGITLFPIGMPDGGRDALYRQNYPDTNANFTAFQVKFARSQPLDIFDWATTTVKNELEKIERLILKGANAYHFICNVQATSHLDSGSMDRVERELRTLIPIPLTCWWRNDLNRRLDNSWNIKLRYPETLTGQDFFRLLIDNNENHTARLNATRAFIANQYKEDEEVKFKQVELQNKLLDLFVDLPFRIEFRRSPRKFAIHHPGNAKLSVIHESASTVVLGANDDSISNEPFGTATLLLSDIENNPIDTTVIEGAPGQGKSTLLQYICQVHRIRILGKKDDIEAIPQPHRTAPLYIPIKVDLRDLSDWLTGIDPFNADQKHITPDSTTRTLETFLARLIQDGSGGLAFETNDLIEISKLNPLLIALDGLDEVADIKRRAEVVSAVSRASSRIRENCPNAKIIVTSRPAAFANSPGFDLAAFPHIQLGSVQRTQINLYAAKWVAAKGLTRQEKLDFDRILDEKMDYPHLRDLARNPMQLTILLSLILTKGPALPDKRTTLYDQYVDLFFSRESTKNLSVRRHLDLLKDIHRYLAWKLHTAAEIGNRAAAGRFTLEELRAVLREYLEVEQQDTAVIDEIFVATLERVFMIVSRVEGTFEFEVQPLREYFAARFLYDTASYSPPGRERAGTKPDRFDAVAQNFYWLNVARFLAGCFSKGELLDLADRVCTLMDEGRLANTSHPETLAAMLLSDWVFAQSPKATAQISGKLAEHRHLAKLLPAGYWDRERTIQLPKTSGGAEILTSARKWITNKELRTDVLIRLGSYIATNSSTKDNLDWWLGTWETTNDFSRWLAIGEATRANKEAPPDEIIRRAGDINPNPHSVAILCGMGIINPMLSSSARVKQFECLFLDHPYWFPDFPDGSVFHLAPYILTHGAFSMKAAIHEKSAIETYADNHNVSAFPQIPETIETEENCREFSHYTVSKLQSIEGRATLKEWEPIIEEALRRFGHRPAVYLLALRCLSLPVGEFGRPKKVDLFNTTTPLAQRLRFAKTKSKSIDWWRQTLQQASNADERLLGVLSLWLLTSVGTIIENSDVIISILQAMDNRELNKPTSLLTELSRFGYSDQSSKKDLPPEIPTHPSLAYLVAIKGNAHLADKIFLDIFASTTDDFLGLDGFRQAEALRCAMSKELDWDTALKIIEETYNRGESFGIEFAGVFRTLPRELPQSIANQILSTNDKYPLRLLEVAASRIRRDAQSQIKSVGSIAKRDKWFN